MDNERALLDKIATSPDPVIRGFVLRYKEYEAEMKRLVDFFEIYDKGFSPSAKPNSGVSAPAVASASPAMRSLSAVAGSSGAPVKRGPGRPPRDQTVKADPDDEFAARIRDIITQLGRPSPLKELHQYYENTYPEDIVNIENMRQRLFKRRSVIELQAHVGYWPIGLVISSGDSPGTSEDEQSDVDEMQTEGDAG